MTSGPKFSAPWGRAVTVVSLLAPVLLIGVAGIVTSMLPEARSVLRVCVAALPLIILAGGTLFTVSGYTIEGRCLVVHRLLWSTRVGLDGFQSAVIDPEAMQGSLRIFGNGGLFGISGLFRNQKLGIYRAFVTDPKRCVVLRVADGTLVVSPDRPEDFVRLVSQ